MRLAMIILLFLHRDGVKVLTAHVYTTVKTNYATVNVTYYLMNNWLTKATKGDFWLDIDWLSAVALNLVLYAILPDTTIFNFA